MNKKHSMRLVVSSSSSVQQQSSSHPKKPLKCKAFSRKRSLSKRPRLPSRQQEKYMTNWLQRLDGLIQDSEHEPDCCLTNTTTGASSDGTTLLNKGKREIPAVTMALFQSTPGRPSLKKPRRNAFVIRWIDTFTEELDDTDDDDVERLSSTHAATDGELPFESSALPDLGQMSLSTR
jgi:hypothetical protein